MNRPDVKVTNSVKIVVRINPEPIAKRSSPVFSYAQRIILEANEEILLVINDATLDRLGEQINKVCQDKMVHVKALLTGEGTLICEQFMRHPPIESELQGILDMFLLVVDHSECLIANTNHEIEATITTNPNLVHRTAIYLDGNVCSNGYTTN